MLVEKLICSNITVMSYLDNVSTSLQTSGATYSASEDLTDDGVIVTETISATLNAGCCPEALLSNCTQYEALINNQKKVGTPRYPLIKSLSVDNGKLSLTFERKSPKI